MARGAATEGLQAENELGPGPKGWDVGSSSETPTAGDQEVTARTDAVTSPSSTRFNCDGWGDGDGDGDTGDGDGGGFDNEECPTDPDGLLYEGRTSTDRSPYTYLPESGCGDYSFGLVRSFA